NPTCRPACTGSTSSSCRWRIIGDGAVGIEIVAGPMEWVEHRDRIAGAPERLIAGRIIGAGHPYGAAAGLPGVGGALPGFAARFARRRNRVFAPDKLAVLGVDRGDPIAHAGVAP